MSTRTIRVFDDGEALSEAAARVVASCAPNGVAQRGRFTLALSGGSTPKRLYQLLTTEPYRSKVDWSRVEIFWGDERCVPPDHPQSNYRMAREAMLDHLPIPAEHIHRMEAERVDLDAAAHEYQQTLARVFAVDAGGPPPALDLALQGMGPDGHTASLFPHTEALKETVRWVVPNHVPQLKTQRMTMTFPILNRARHVLFLVAGADKAERLAEVLTGPPDPQRLPSQSIQPVNGQLTWFIERAAATQLPDSLIQNSQQGFDA